MKKSLIKQSLMAGAVAMAMGASAGAYAAGAVNFDTNGAAAGGQITIDQFNWGNQSILAQGFFSGDAPNTGPVLTGTLFGHGQLTSARLAGTNSTAPVPPGGPGTPVFTYQFSVEVTASINKAGNNTTFSNYVITPNGATNFFRMYYDPTSNVNLSTGLGFGTSNGEVNADQFVILSGKLDLGTPLNVQHNTGVADGTTPDSPLDFQTPPGVTSGPWTIEAGGTLRLNIDICNTGEQAAPATHPKCLAAGVDTVDANFFPNTVMSSLTIDMNLNGGIQAPYEQHVPPALVVNNPINFGTPVSYPALYAGTRSINNFTCDNAAGVGCDMLFQGQNGLSAVNGSVIPEPGSLALLGLGLAGLGFASRRRKA